MKTALAALSLLVLLALPGAAAEPADVANSIASEIMSPWCPGVTVHDCPSPESMELRDQIERWAAAGWSRDRIIERLVDEYGERILGSPPARGVGLLAWILPLLGIVAGASLAARLLTKWTSRPRGERPVVATPEERERLEHELALYRTEA